MLLIGCSKTQPINQTPHPEKKSAVVSSKSKTVATKSLSSSKYKFDNGFIGTWIVEGSSAQFIIRRISDAISFSGKDLEDQEQFQILFMDWGPSEFLGEFIMPSTNHRTKMKLSIIDKNNLYCEFSGDSFGKAVWKRK